MKELTEQDVMLMLRNLKYLRQDKTIKKVLSQDEYNKFLWVRNLKK